jgi:UDP-glucose 4-epimerase
MARCALNMTQRFLVTGGAGFIGAHLVERLLEQGHRVAVVDDFSTGSANNLKRFIGDVEFVRGSVLESDAIDRLAARSDVIVHLAAAVGVQLVIDHPVRTIETNVMGTETVLRAALRYGCRTMIASTSEVYGKSTQLPFAEGDDVVLGPTSRRRWAYAASKMIDEFLGLAYHDERGLAVTVFRLFNTVGPGQTGRYGMVLPRLVRQALRGEDMTVFGDGQQRRCFCDARDAISGILALAESQEAIGQVFNIGGSEEISILELAKRIHEETSSSSKIVFVSYEQAYGQGFEDIARRVPNTSKIRKLTGWQQSRGLGDIVRDVVAYERLKLPQATQ